MPQWKCSVSGHGSFNIRKIWSPLVSFIPFSEDKTIFPGNSSSYGLWLAAREMCRSPERQAQEGIGYHSALRVSGAGVAGLTSSPTTGCRNTAAARLLSLPGPVGSPSLSSSWTELGYPAKRAGTCCGQLPLSESDVVRHGSQLLLDGLHFTLRTAFLLP